MKGLMLALGLMLAVALTLAVALVVGVALSDTVGNTEGVSDGLGRGAPMLKLLVGDGLVLRVMLELGLRLGGVLRLGVTLGLLLGGGGVGCAFLHSTPPMVTVRPQSGHRFWPQTVSLVPSSFTPSTRGVATSLNSKVHS